VAESYNDVSTLIALKPHSRCDVLIYCECCLLTPTTQVLDRRRYRMSWGPATVFIHQRLNLDGTTVASANGHFSSDVSSSSDADNYSDDGDNASDCTDSSDDDAVAALDAAVTVNNSSSSTSKQQNSPCRSAEQSRMSGQVCLHLLLIPFLKNSYIQALATHVL
jgi:hypothetical protein